MDDDPSTFFDSGKVTCQRCGKVNDLGSSEALYWADESTQCKHCGFLFIRHQFKMMDKTIEIMKTDPELAKLVSEGRYEEIKRRLNELVPFDT